MILPVAMRRQARRKETRTDGRVRPVARSPRRVLIVAVPPVRTLDLFGPVEVFGDANRLHGGDLAYEVNIISSGPERVVLSHMGTPLNTAAGFHWFKSGICNQLFFFFEEVPCTLQPSEFVGELVQVDGLCALACHAGIAHSSPVAPANVSAEMETLAEVRHEVVENVDKSLELVHTCAKSTLHFERDFSRSGRLRPNWCGRDFCSAVGSVIRRSRISRPSVVGSTMSALCSVESRASAFIGHLRCFVVHCRLVSDLSQGCLI
jgi:hypothetical protein